MRILVGNNHLDKTGGTESYTFALATILKEFGHEVEYFTFNKGLYQKNWRNRASLSYLITDEF